MIWIHGFVAFRWYGQTIALSLWGEGPADGSSRECIAEPAIFLKAKKETGQERQGPGSSLEM